MSRKEITPNPVVAFLIGMAAENSDLIPTDFGRGSFRDMGCSDPVIDKAPKNLDDLFMELFPKEYLESLPPKEIETLIENLKLIESDSVTIPSEWLALKNVLQRRGFLVSD